MTPLVAAIIGTTAGVLGSALLFLSPLVRTGRLDHGSFTPHGLPLDLGWVREIDGRACGVFLAAGSRGWMACRELPSTAREVAA